MLELTKQERFVIVFLLAAAILGIGMLCYKGLLYKPKIEVISKPQLEKEINESRIIDINKASEGDFVRLKGIGPALAREIVEYRAASGGFKYKEEIKKVKGIGEVKYDEIKDNIKV